MDGILVDLLNAKWNTFVKSRFYRQFFLFCFYFVLSLVSFTLRPGPTVTPSASSPAATSQTSVESPMTTPKPDQLLPNVTNTFQNTNLSLLLDQIITTAFTSNMKYSSNATTAPFDKLKFDIVADLTSVLSNVLSTDRLRNEIEFLNDSYRIATRPNELYYSKNDTTLMDYLKFTMINDTVPGNSTMLFDDTMSAGSNKHNWCVVRFIHILNVWNTAFEKFLFLLI